MGNCTGIFSGKVVGMFVGYLAVGRVNGDVDYTVAVVDSFVVDIAGYFVSTSVGFVDS